MNRRFLFLLGSSRLDGNTELLARQAAARLPDGVVQRWIHLAEHPLPAFTDVRHRPDVCPTLASGTEAKLLGATLWATDLVLATPLYWYSVSASTKLYLDYWSGWMRLPGICFKERMQDRTLWGISVLAEHDATVATPLEGMLRLSADYLGMRWGGLLLGNGSAPGQVLEDTTALSRADRFFGSDCALAA